MFKRLRGKIIEENVRYPSHLIASGSTNIQVIGNSSEKQLETCSGDLISLSENYPLELHGNKSYQFSIGDEDGSQSDQNTPKKLQFEAGSGDSVLSSKLAEERRNSSFAEIQQMFSQYFSSKESSFVPQSDIESEVEDSPHMDSLSKEQLVMDIHKLKNSLHKYKSHYSELVKAYRDLNGEKSKILKTLSESQDKALRRISELREQCQLEQNAKAHLEENLRIMLEEKEEVIQVLQTKVNLLKEGASGYQENVQTDDRPQPEGGNAEDIPKKTVVEVDSSLEDTIALRDKVKRLEALLNKCKDTIKGNKERYSQIVQEKERLSTLLAQESQRLQEDQEKEAEVQASLRAELQQMKERLVYLEHQEEESIMAMAETKRNMHQELELREKQLRQIKDELADSSKEKESLEKKFNSLQQNVNCVQKQHEEEICTLNNQIKVMEKTIEEEKENLMQEFSRGKAEAFVLMQQECEKKIASIESEWKKEIQELKENQTEEIFLKNKEIEDKIQELSHLQDKLLQTELNNTKEAEEMKAKVINIEKEKQNAVSDLQNKLFQVDCKYKNEIEVWKANFAKIEKENQDAYTLQETHTQAQVKWLEELEEMKKTINSIEKEKQEIVCNLEKKLQQVEANYNIEIEEIKLQALDIQNEKDKEISALKEELNRLELNYNKEMEAIKGKEEISILEEKLLHKESDYQSKLEEKDKNIIAIEKEKQKEISDLEEKLIRLESYFSEKIDGMNSVIIATEKEKNEALNEVQRLMSLEISAEEMKKIECDTMQKLTEKQKELNDVTAMLNKVQVDHKTKFSNLESHNYEVLAKKDSCIEELTKKILLLENIQKETVMDFETRIHQFEEGKIGEYKDKLSSLQKEVDNQVHMIEEKNNKIKELQEKLNIQVNDNEEQMQTFKSQIEKMQKEVMLLESDKSSNEILMKEDFRKESNQKDEEFKAVKSSLEAKILEHKEQILEKEKDVEEERQKNMELQTSQNKKCEHLKEKIQYLEEEREKMKFRIDTIEEENLDKILSLKKSHSDDMMKLKAELGVINSQLDESLLVAEANQTASNKEMDFLKSEVDRIQSERKLTEKEKEDIAQKLHFFESENAELINYKKYYEIAKQEKEIIESRVQFLENQVQQLEDQYKKEVDILKNENDKLKVSCSKYNSSLIKVESNDYALKGGCQRITEEAEVNLQSNLFDCSNSISTDASTYTDSYSSFLINKDADASPLEKLKNEYEEKLAHKETKLKYVMKHLIHHFSSQQERITEENEEYLEQAIARAREQEEILLREHRLELASLRQDLFEKDCALEEMREHFQEQLQEKESKLTELEKMASAHQTTKLQKETSDWEDEWVDTEELISTTTELEKDDCFQELNSLKSTIIEQQNEVECLTHAMNLEKMTSSRSIVPEITEFEYLRNILYEYMMGKEQLVLAKVIAAVLRFSQEQTEQVLERENNRQSQTRNLFT